MNILTSVSPSSPSNVLLNKLGAGSLGGKPTDVVLTRVSFSAYRAECRWVESDPKCKVSRTTVQPPSLESALDQHQISAEAIWGRIRHTGFRVQREFVFKFEGWLHHLLTM